MTELSEIFKTRDNLVGIEDGTLRDLVGMGKLIHLPHCDRLARRGKNAGNLEACNSYYEIAEMRGTVYMHLQYGYGIIIPKYVLYGAKKINVVKRLSRYYWCICTNNEKPIATALNRKEVYRAIWAIVLYGDETVNMPSILHVHHKSFRWWNEMETTAVVCRKMHEWHHNSNGNLKSHQSGYFIRTVDGFDRFIASLKLAKEILKDRRM